MKILTLKEFLECPEGTLFCKLYGNEKSVDAFDNLAIKLENASGNDFCYQSLESWDSPKGEDHMGYIIDQLEKPEKSFPFDPEATSRDGFYESDQLFCVFSIEEHQRVIDLLQAALEKE